MERKIADIGLRVYGHVIDLIILLLTPIVMLYLLGLSAAQLKGASGTVQAGLAAIVYLALAIAEGFGGRTPGKLMAGTRVVTKKGYPINIAQSIIRNTLRIVDFVGFYAVGIIIMKFSYLRQRLGDHMASTIVVYEGDDPEYDEDNNLPTVWVHPPNSPVPDEADDA